MTTLLAAGLLACAVALPAVASDDGAATTEGASAALDSDLPSEGWHFALTPYFWLPSQHGNVTVKNQSAPVDLDLSDMANLLKDDYNGAFVLHAEVSKGLVTGFADAMYLDLENDKDTKVGSARASYTQGIYELGLARAVVGNPTMVAEQQSPLTLEPLFGVRFYTLDASIIGSGGNVNASGSQAWADIFGGIRANIRLDQTFSLFGRGDIGAGGSDLVWNVSAGLDVRCTSWLSLEGGYRWLDVDYSDGHGSDQFVYDMQLAGPFVALTLRF